MLRQGNVCGVVRRDGVAQLESAAAQAIDRRPAVDWQVVEVGEHVLGTGRAEVPTHAQSTSAETTS